MRCELPLVACIHSPSFPSLLYILQSQKPQGAIPLTNLTVVELDNEEPDTADTDRRATRKSRASSKLNRIVLITAAGRKYVLEAPSIEERDAWVSELQIAVASQRITPS